MLISSAIKSDNFPADLFVREKGPLSLSRWMTTVKRVLRLAGKLVYVKGETPSHESKMLVSFILKSCMHVWDKIKKCKYLI